MSQETASIQATPPLAFDFDSSNVIRVVNNEKGQPLFVAKDICQALGYVNHNDAIKSMCNPEGVANSDPLGKDWVANSYPIGNDGVSNRYPIIDSMGRTKYPLLINEGNVYRLIFKSNKPQAKPFERFVCDTVLPSIRQTGSFSVNRAGTAPEQASLLPPASSRPTRSPQAVFQSNYKLACLIFKSHAQRLDYANRTTKEQTGTDILEDAGIHLSCKADALQLLLAQTIDDHPVSSLLDSVHYNNDDRTWAKTQLESCYLKLKDGVLYVANPCPFIGKEGRKALQAITGARVNVAIFMQGKTFKSTAIELY
ncbi:BRO-N domain-containing protein [Methylovulum psychrotolerans]|uniref:Bro-N domain-containing protein n=1 Tax=Methylovulum psychrotolerans TaxID=1704499 RepID=A0A2S5CGE6_9GAMM|nr:BRO family protein [Methylovulum psychrotolerans]POZ49869.1 hypothetical protein AADEFJLK_04315 [Methylovulum psychrotolerans]